MWLVEATEQLLRISFASYGILPRSIPSLPGVLTSPFLHGEWDHLFSNSLPFLVLSSLLFLVYKRVSYRVFFLIYILTGLSVWAFARGASYHIGASGLVYGLFGFVFFSGLFRGDIKSIGVALAVGFFYGGMVWGVLPVQPGVSWESHLLGVVFGAGLAWHYRNVDKPVPPEWMEEREDRRTFQDFIDKYDR